MRKLIFTFFAAALIVSACTSTNKTEEAKQDSIAEAAAADSMLNSAMQDTVKRDTLGADSAATAK